MLFTLRMTGVDGGVGVGNSLTKALSGDTKQN